MKRLYRKIPILIYIAIVAFIIGTSVYLGATAHKASQIAKAMEGSFAFSDGWSLADGTPVENPAKLNLLPGASDTAECSIYTTVPDNIPDGMSLCFRAKHLYFSVLLDDRLVYTQDLPENLLYTNSVGATWVFIPLECQDAGKTLELRFTLCYANSSCGIDYLQIASERGMILDLMNKKLLGFFNAIVYLTLAAVLIVLDLPMSSKLDHSHEFLYLGLITLGVAMYCLVETQLFQLFIGNERIMHILSCYSLLLLPMPIVLYTNSLFDLRNKYIVPVFSVIYGIVFTMLVIFNATDIADFHDTLTVVHIMLLAAVVIMFSSIIRYIVKALREENRTDLYLLFEIVGLSLLLVASLIDVARFYFASVQDPARYIRIGLLGFVVCYAIASSEKLLTALKLSAQAELMAKLAYQDGLTGLYNRTAYNKKLEELRTSKIPVGICTFDVNNLKQTNDTLGHEAGDELLRESARLINAAFEANGGICYRIGGDEFIALLPSANAEQLQQLSIEQLGTLCEECNANHKHPFQINIAKGSSIYNGGASLEAAVITADKRMYENKRNMKNG